MNRNDANTRNSAVSASILAPLDRLRRQARLYIALDGVERLLVAILGAVAIQFILDRWLKLPVDQRALINVVITFIWLSVLYRRILLRVIQPITDGLLAAAVDRANPDLHDKITTAVQFSGGQVGDAGANSPQLVASVIREACESAPQIRFDAVLNHAQAKSSVLRSVGLVVLGLLPLLIIPDITRTWFQRNWLMQDVPWPQNTYLRPESYDSDGRRTVPQGDPLEIAAQIVGEAPDEIVIEWWTSSGQTGKETMTILAGERRTKTQLGPATEAVHFRLSGGDERTREFIAEPVERPSVVKTTVEIEPPTYTGLPPSKLEQQTSIELLRGSQLRISADLNKPVRSAKFVNAAGAEAPCILELPDRALVHWADPTPGTFEFKLVDTEGWENSRSVRYVIKVLPDQPPVVKLALKDVGDAVTPKAEIAFDAAFSDVYGLSRTAVFVQRNDDPAVAIPTGDLAAKTRETKSEGRVSLSALAAAPGQRVRIWAEAADIDPAGPNIAKSQPVELRVLSPADFLAEMANRELELRQEFERLISEQNGLKVAVEQVLPTLPAIGPTPAQPGQRLAGLARRQEAHAARALAVERGFDRILAEMRTSRVLRPTEERRIAERIVTPLDRIGLEGMPAIAGQIAELRRESEQAKAARLPVTMADLARRMKSVLADMLENEGFREAVALLQEIIQQQGDVHSATVDALSKDIEAIIGLDEPTTRPKP